ncbi:hypothetical protein AB8849_05410 [Proteus vulgaris]
MSEIQQVIFDGMILYDKEAAKITNLLDTKKVATLTVPANECLAIVLKNSPDVTTQKQLFHEVWEVSWYSNKFEYFLSEYLNHKKGV